MWLAALGGSWAYIATGIGLLASGVLLIHRRIRAGLGVYAPLLIATLSWDLWEVGSIAGHRYIAHRILAVVGLWLLTPASVFPLAFFQSGRHHD